MPIILSNIRLDGRPKMDQFILMQHRNQIIIASAVTWLLICTPVDQWRSHHSLLSPASIFQVATAAYHRVVTVSVTSPLFVCMLRFEHLGLHMFTRSVAIMWHPALFSCENKRRLTHKRRKRQVFVTWVWPNYQ